MDNVTGENSINLHFPPFCGLPCPPFWSPWRIVRPAFWLTCRIGPTVSESPSLRRQHLQKSFLPLPLLKANRLKTRNWSLSCFLASIPRSSPPLRFRAKGNQHQQNANRWFTKAAFTASQNPLCDLSLSVWFRETSSPLQWTRMPNRIKQKPPHFEI